MNDYDTSDYSTPPVTPHNYSLEEYLRLRDTLNSEKNKLPDISKEGSVSFFVFTLKYVVPTVLLCVFLRPIAHAFGVNSGMIFVLAAIGYLIYKLPSISRAMREQEAIDLAERNNEEYEAFLLMQEKEMKKNKRKRIL